MSGQVEGIQGPLVAAPISVLFALSATGRLAWAFFHEISGKLLPQDL